MFPISPMKSCSPCPSMKTIIILQKPTFKHSNIPTIVKNPLSSRRSFTYKEYRNWRQTSPQFTIADYKTYISEKPPGQYLV